MTSFGGRTGGSRILLSAKSLAVVLALFLLMGSIQAAGAERSAASVRADSKGQVLPRSVGQPFPDNVQIAHDYYYYVPFSNPYSVSIQLKFGVTSSVEVDVYVMSQSQFTAFKASGSTTALYHSFTSIATGSTNIPASSTSYIVVWNDASQITATVQIAGSTNPVNVYRFYSGPPSPVGIADYGVENYTGAPLPYELTSTGVQATAKIYSMRAYNSTAPSGVDKAGASLQLNVMLGINTSRGQFSYWLQNVATFRTDLQTVYYQSEIFNMSLYNANLTSSLISGNGRVYPLPSQPPESQNTYIFDTATSGYTLPYFSQFQITVSQSTSSVTVKFGYLVTENGAPVQGSTVSYDTVIISEPNSITGSGIVVDGYKVNPFGSFYDSEFVFGGEYNGEATTFTQMNTALSMLYQLAGGALAQPRSLYEFGSDTAETTYNLQTQYTSGIFSVGVGTTSFHQNYILPGGVVVPFTLSYSVVGGSPASSNAPVFTFISGGVKQSDNLPSTPTIYYVDSGTQWSVVSFFPNTNNEQWSTTSPVAGTATSSLTTSIVYFHQYVLNVGFSIAGGGAPGSPTLSYSSMGVAQTLSLSGGSGQSVWSDVGSTFSATNPLGSSSSTERWYSAGSNGTVSAPLTLTLTYNHQYLLTIVSQTTTTVWENAGMVFQQSIQEVFGRSNGVGFRVTSASLDSGSPQALPLTTGTDPFSITMNGPHTLTYALVKQYQVVLQGDATKALSSISSPTISGDQYWFDSGSQVAVALNGVWGRGSGTGSRLSSYSVDGGAAVLADTAGTVSALSVSSISSTQTVSATAQSQYQLSTPTGSVSSVTPPAIAGDTGWYDSGSSVAIRYNTTWNLVPQQSRLNAKSYSIDSGLATPIVQSGNTTFVVTATMSAPHLVDVKSATQYYVAFVVTDAAGVNNLKSSVVQISTGGEAVQILGAGTFLDNGTVFTVSGVTYEGLDVNPSGTGEHTVTGPSSVSVKALVYDAKLRVTDLLGLPVAGAGVKMTLANGNVLSGTTASDGTYVAPQIPLGTFTASISGPVSSAQITGDASKQGTTAVSVLFSTTSLVLLILLVIAVVVVSALILRRRNPSAKPSP